MNSPYTMWPWEEDCQPLYISRWLSGFHWLSFQQEAVTGGSRDRLSRCAFLTRRTSGTGGSRGTLHSASSLFTNWSLWSYWSMFTGRSWWSGSSSWTWYWGPRLPRLPVLPFGPGRQSFSSLAQNWFCSKRRSSLISCFTSGVVFTSFACESALVEARLFLDLVFWPQK